MSTLDVEVTHISCHGIWLLVAGKEYFLPYDQFPWFRDARLREIQDVELLHGTHLHWPALDVDLCLESIENPDAFPLICQAVARTPPLVDQRPFRSRRRS